MIRPLCAAALALLLAAAPLAAADRVLRVAGEGGASASPDLARVTLGASAEAKSAAQAAGAASKRMSAILAALKGLGLEARDLRTVEIGLSPVWRHDRDSGEPKFIGYSARQTLSATLRDLDGLGAAIDAAIAAGATDVGGVTFDVADRTAIEDAARRAAVADARRIAALAAEAAGVTLGPLASLDLVGGHAEPPRFEARAMPAGAPPVDTPVAPGELSFTVRVEAVYAIE